MSQYAPDERKCTSDVSKEETCLCSRSEVYRQTGTRCISTDSRFFVATQGFAGSRVSHLGYQGESQGLLDTWFYDVPILAVR